VEKRWKIKPKADTEIIKHLSEKLNINEHLANLLAQRGIRTFEEARSFFRPEMKMLHDPFEMKDMDIAIQRIEKAIKANEKILVYGDYDVDGTSAVALVYSYLCEVYPKKENLDFYIPDRYAEGYGISYQSIDFAKENNFNLIIALDCGIKAVEQVAYANEKEIDFIICDHHRPGDELPDAVAVLDPKRLDCTYPFKELSGCGIGFKLAQAFNQKQNKPISEIRRYLDLVVISIASDIVPITGENRILAYFGLKLLNLKPRPGIEAILAFGGILPVDYQLETDEDDLYFNREMTINDLVFLVGPRINAAGRMESGRNSVELLLCSDIESAQKIGQYIDTNNIERRNLDVSITQQAQHMIDTSPLHHNKKSTVVFDKNWSKGVVGIVASRLTETYYRPTIVLTESNGLITGSARSVKDFDIYDAIDSCSDLLEHFGGHKYAAGLSMKPENLQAFIDKFERIVSSTITEEMLVPEVEIDAEINLTDISQKFYKVLKQFAPFGPGNLSPVFLSRDVVDKGYARIVGVNHLKLSVMYKGIYNPEFPAIAFQQGDYLNLISNKPFDISYQIEENEWNGNVNLQLVVKDIKKSGSKYN
jgi:single-stranded-DNA-specific exonuclease